MSCNSLSSVTIHRNKICRWNIELFRTRFVFSRHSSRVSRCFFVYHRHYCYDSSAPFLHYSCWFASNTRHKHFLLDARLTHILHGKFITGTVRWSAMDRILAGTSSRQRFQNYIVHNAGLSMCSEIDEMKRMQRYKYRTTKVMKVANLSFITEIV